MINKPKDWEQVEESEVVEGLRLVPGVYPVQIKEIIDHPEKEYLEIQFDIVKDKTYTDWFKKQEENFGAWPNAGIYRASYKETATKFFKAFITAVQKSNQGYVWNWNEQSLKGKYFVAVMGEEEYEDNEGNIKTSVKIREARSIEAWQKGDVKVPELKKLKVKKEETNNYDPFSAINQISEADIPF